jgi:hypothetical protein
MSSYRRRSEMRHLFVTFAIGIMLFAAGTASAQEPTRIQFGKGKSSAVITGTTGKFGTRYVVRARSGQKLVLTLTPKNGVGLKVETNGSYGEQVLLREERGGTYEVGLEETGDYTIFLGSTGRTPAGFTLTVRITKLADI